MKRKSTREILAESFRELAQDRPVSQITVPDIVSNCGYSKTTFYRLFRDKYDLIAWDYARALKELMDRTESLGYDWKRTLLEAALFFQEHRNYLRNLLLNTRGFDSFSKYIKQIHMESFRGCVLKASGAAGLDVKTEMSVRTYCGGTVDLVCDWILGLYEVSPEELAEVFENCVPQLLREHLR